ncbi:MAG TPA: dihydrolipoamide acetyltransferase family protein [Candidatus Hydrogenedentes bacterium]|jgi:pyruvate dehydrogenase E2 component (dihydrolipoamide acetyltransferase)|nr:dihydrolipoamide acetyltransferase family protein [Candidatus Hydrogenedentota bacterium]
MHEILLPKMGNSVEEAEIVKWFKKEGDAVETGDPLFSIQTDKAEVECESTASGILRKILVPEGVEVPVLTVVALVGDADEALPDNMGAPSASASAPAAQVSAPITGPAAAAPAAPVSPGTGATGKSPVSPRARKAAEALGINPATLSGSGVGGRVMEQDVLASARSGGAVKITPTARRMAENAGLSVAQLSGTGIGGKITKADIARSLEQGIAQAAPEAKEGIRTVPLSPMRRIIADRMCASKYSAPHYYITVEVDMSAAKNFRAANRGFKVSYNDLVLFATARALRSFPAVNARWCGDFIEELSEVNLGMAVALPTGLIVPVIRNAHLLSLEGLSSTAKALAEKAQTGKLLPDDYQGNSFTVSNLGAFGVDQFTAIINQPDSAILAVGQMKDRAVVIDGGIHIRPVMKLTLSSDHRVIDGAVAAQFMSHLKSILEEGAF